MSKYPQALGKFFPNLIFTLAIPASFLAGVLLYEPKALCALMSDNPFTIVISFSIILGTMILTRLPFWLLRKKLPMTLWRYFFWCLGEILIACAFTALFLVLLDGSSDTWFAYWGRCISSIGSILIFAYLVLTLLYCYLDALNAEPVSNDARLKFYDSRHQLKFITTASSVTYIESNENYVQVHYLENAIPKKVQIRTSMKNIEPLCEQAGFARAHRCYIINPLHVKQIRKEIGGLTFADITGGPEEGIPVSKKYYGSIAAML